MSTAVPNYESGLGDRYLALLALALGLLGTAVSLAIAGAAVYNFMTQGGRPDASEVRDLWLLVAFEVAITTAGATVVLLRISRRKPQPSPTTHYAL